MTENGYFVISLDFEIYWGVRDVVTLEKYRDNLLGVRKAIPAMLDTFAEHNINTTFATVGFLFFHDKAELLNGCPEKKPAYKNQKLSPYNDHFNTVGNNEQEDPLHFAPSLIKKILDYGQEIGCHTFSHYYCLEAGQTIENFRDDLQAAKRVAGKRGITLKSLVFPRNQYDENYLQICKEEGFTSFRGNESSWVYKPHTHQNETYLLRLIRIIDTYINVTGHHCSVFNPEQDRPVNIPASRFLRPYSKNLALLDGLRLKRITDSMTYAAKNNLVYHIWWHPHNFGSNLEQNLLFLKKILLHYKKLADKYRFTSVSMTQLAESVTGNNGK